MADAKRAPYMAKVSYNEFRKLHKGTPKKEMSELWKQYKNDEYELPVEEATTVEEQVEETVVEEQAEEKEDLMVLFGQLFNDVFNNAALTDSEKAVKKGQLAKLAKETGYPGYTCDPTDGWKLWLGPTKAAVLCNESKRVAFACNRSYWQAFYHGASLCYVETCTESETVHRMADNYRKQGRFVERVPVPGIEIMLPASKLEIINKASGSWNP
jgi:hypothetical protein